MNNSDDFILRRLDRLNKLKLNNEDQNESENVINSVKLLDLYQNNHEIIPLLYYNINNMNNSEINSFSYYFPYCDMLSLIIKIDDDNRKQLIFEIICIMIMGSEFDPYDFINPTILTILMISTDIPKFSPYSFFILSFLCKSNPKLIIVLCEQGLLQQLNKEPINCVKSQLILIISLYPQTQEIANEISTLIIKLLQSENLLICKDGLKSYLALKLNTQNESFRNVAETITEFIRNNIFTFLNITDPKFLSYFLNIMSTINKLSDNIIPKLFHIAIAYNENEKIVQACSNVFYVQYPNWNSSCVDVDKLYSVFLPTIINSPHRFQKLIFQTLLKYGDYEHFCNKQIIDLIIQFLESEEMIQYCLPALLLLLSTPNQDTNIISYILTFKDDIIIALNNEIDNGTEESSLISIKILELVEKDCM